MALQQEMQVPALWRIEVRCDTCNKHLGTMRDPRSCEELADRFSTMAPLLQDQHICYTGIERSSA